MKWENYQSEAVIDLQHNLNRISTNIECPRCGKYIWKRTDIVLTTYPPKYKYECDCGWSGTAYK